MKKQLIAFVLVILFLAGLGIISIFAQESESQGVPQVAETQALPSLPESEVLWLWGEVVSVDTVNKQMVVKYLDYETDAESQISINIDDKTTYENIKSLDEIKAQDTVSIDYTVNPEGKNIAKNINVEKNEGIQNLPEENKEEPKAPPSLE